MALRDKTQERLLSGKKRHSKYRNKIIMIAGDRFHSIAEAAQWIMLLDWQAKGIISDLRRQVKYEFRCGVKYFADFVFKEKGRFVIQDVKGMRSREFVIKAKLMRSEYGVIIDEVHVDPKTASAIVAGYLGRAITQSEQADCT